MKDNDIARLALVTVWLGTVVASLYDGGHAGAALLRHTGLDDRSALAVVWLGSAWDLAVGLALLLWPRVWTYRVAALSVIGLTAVATAVLPSLWLDPFGALLKNLPVLVLLWQLEKEARA